MRKSLFRGVALRGMTAAERAKGRYMRSPDAHPQFEGKTATEIGAWIRERLQLVGAEGRELKARIDELEQRADRPRGMGGMEIKSYGEQVAESDAFKALRDARFHGKARIELKAITNASAGMATVTYNPEPVQMSYRQTRIRDLLTVLPTSSLQVQYPRQTTRTNSAAPVAEGTQKPYSNYGWTIQTVTMRTIAHLAKLTRQALDDAPLLQATVDGEMRYGLQLVEDTQLLYGDGAGENLTGMMPLATPYALPAGLTLPSSPTMIDKLGAAILQQALTDFPADGIVLHPTDWMAMRMLKDSTGTYLFGKPGEQVTPALFGLPIATTAGMTQGSFLLGAMRPQILYDRLAPEVLISTENADDFEKNLATLRAEQRIALAVRLPGGLVKGTFS